MIESFGVPEETCDLLLFHAERVIYDEVLLLLYQSHLWLIDGGRLEATRVISVLFHFWSIVYSIVVQLVRLSRTG